MMSDQSTLHSIFFLFGFQFHGKCRGNQKVGEKGHSD
jgi:hypothetical protein